MATYRIAVEPDGKTYRLVKVAPNRIIVVYPKWNLLVQAQCSGLDDILQLSDYDNVKYAPGYDYGSF